MGRLVNVLYRSFAAAAGSALLVAALAPFTAFGDTPDESAPDAPVAAQPADDIEVDPAGEPDAPEPDAPEAGEPAAQPEAGESDAPEADAPEAGEPATQPEAPETDEPDAADPATQPDAPDAGEPATQPEAPEAGEPAVDPEPPAADEPEAQSGPGTWTVTLKLSSFSVSAGNLVVATPQVSGISKTGLTYNYVWERDGWAEWSSTVKETSAKTSNDTFDFYPTKPGLYTLMVDVTDGSGKTVTAISAYLTVTQPSWNVTAKTDKASVQVHNPVNVSTSLTVSKTGFTYNFIWERDNWASWDSTVNSTGSFSSSDTFSFTPVAAGVYNVYVDVKDPKGAVRTVPAGSVTVTEPAWTATASLSTSTAELGQDVVMTPKVTGIDTSGFTYNYVWNYQNAWEEWGSTVGQTGAPTSNASYTFKPTKTGTYGLYVDVISPSGTTRTCITTLTVTEPAWNATVSLSAPTITVGQSVTVMPTVVNPGTETFTYNYVWNYEGKWQEWGSTVQKTGSRTSASAWTFTPTKSGTYVLSVDVVDSKGATRTVDTSVKVLHDWTYTNVNVSADLIRSGGSVIIAPQVSGNTSGITYNYVWMKDGWAQWNSTVNQTGSATTSNTWTFVPPEYGNYTVYVDVIGTDGVAETLSCEVAVWELLGVNTYANGFDWTLSANLGISNASQFGFKYNYIYNRNGAWLDWNSTVNMYGSMTTATSGTSTLYNGGTYDMYVDVVAPDGQKATAGKTVVSYAGDEADMWRRINSLYSPTDYLVAADTSSCVVGVYQWQNGNWVQIRRWPCTVGAWSTPTRTGLYSIQEKGYSFDSYGVRCFWYSVYSGPYYFHSICYWPNGSIQDGRLGMHLSHGCIRLDTANAKWIYDYVPTGSTVYVY